MPAVLEFKVFIYVQGGINILLKLTSITQFPHLFSAERSRQSQRRLDSVQKLNLAKVNLNNISNVHYNQRLASISFFFCGLIKCSC